MGEFISDGLSGDERQKQGREENPHLLVVDGVGYAAGAGAPHPGLRGDPLALQLGGVGGDDPLGHQHGG